VRLFIAQRAAERKAVDHAPQDRPDDTHPRI
jgi:hypothetical protein